METLTAARIKIRARFYLPLPDVHDPKDLQGILALLPEDHPVKIALTGGGVWLAEPQGRAPLAIPIRRISLKALGLLPASLCDAESSRRGLVIRLNDDMARLTHAWEAIQEGMPYNWEQLLSQYLVDLGKESGRKLRRLLAARVNGISGQVVTEARCKRGEIHLAAKAAEKLMSTVQKQYPEMNITTVAQMDGLRVLLQRFPVLGKHGCRWVTLRIVNDRPHMLIYVNAVDWNKLHKGDEDGDLGYVGIPRHSSQVVKVPVTRVAAWPQLTFKNQQPVTDELVAGWSEKPNEAKVETVINFFTKDCIGPQTYMMNCLARGAGFEYARTMATAEQRLEALGKLTRGVFSAAEPMAELVFDGRKTEGALGKFLGVVDAFQDAVAGRPFTVAPFHDFLENDEQRSLLAGAVTLAGGSLRSCRSTAYGMIIAAGRKIAATTWDDRKKELVSNAGRIIDRLLLLGITPETMLDRLVADAKGIQFIEMPRKDHTWIKDQVENVTEDMDAEPEEETGEEPVTGRLLVPTQIRGMQQILLSVSENGVPAFSNITLTQQAEGDLVVTATLREVWSRGQQRVWPVEFRLPDPEQGAITPDGHRVVRLTGISDRVFLPRFVWTGKDLWLQLFDTFLAHTVAEAVGRVKGWMDKEEASEELNARIRRLVNALPAHVAAELPVRMAEFEVIVAGTGEMRTDWANREAALNLLVENGYDVTTTSKSAPGTIVSKSWKRGIPRYLFAVNPLIPCLDLKRRPEGREVRLALPLWKPVAPAVVSKGSRLPAAMQAARTELRCVIADVPGYNLFVDENGEEFGHDTGLALPSALEKLACRAWEFTCANEAEVENLTERLLDAGMGIDAIRVERNLNLVGEGLSIDSFRVQVDAKITDYGKVKACVGPFKFVMNPLPHRLFAISHDGSRTEIDVILPGTTVKKKRALDALLYMLAARAGVAEVEPEFEPGTLLAQLRERLAARGEDQDGRQPVVVVNPDGSEAELGLAVVGMLPFYRPVQTGFSQFKVREGEGGIKVQTHAMLMAGGVDYDIPTWVKEEFAETVSTRRAVQRLKNRQECVDLDCAEVAPPVGV